MIKYLLKYGKDSLYDLLPWTRGTTDAALYRSRPLLFCITPGRSGSNYLADVLNTAGNAVARHEPMPTMTSRYIGMVNRLPLSETYQKRSRKCEAIARTLRALDRETVYCETTHMFITTFYDVVCDFFANVGVIILRRSVPDVVRSFYKLGYLRFPHCTWYNWIPAADAVTNVLPFVGKKNDPFDVITHYVIDIEARALRFREAYPAIKTFELSFDDINSLDGMKLLFSFFRLSFTDQTAALIGSAKNRRERQKKSDPSRDRQFYVDRVLSYTERLKSAGVRIPETLALKPPL